MNIDPDLLPLSREDIVTIGDTDLPAKVRELIRHGHSENTRRAYASDLRAFIAWGGSIPTSPEELARYIADEGGRLHPSTIQRRLTAIATAHGLLDVGGTPHLHPMVRASLRGLQRLHGCQATTGRPAAGRGPMGYPRPHRGQCPGQAGQSTLAGRVRGRTAPVRTGRAEHR